MDARNRGFGNAITIVTNPLAHQDLKRNLWQSDYESFHHSSFSSSKSVNLWSFHFGFSWVT